MPVLQPSRLPFAQVQAHDVCLGGAWCGRAVLDSAACCFFASEHPSSSLL
jgi:hypothetical protein